MSLLENRIYETIPEKPYCTNQLGYMQVLPKLQAMNKNYIQYNHLNLSTLIYDLDYEVNIYDLEHSLIPAPNLVAMNQENGHAHIFYQLDKPVYQSNYKQMNSPAFKYASAVDKKLTIGHKADMGFAGLLAKNVFKNDTWQIFDLHGNLFALGDLDINVKIDRRERFESGLGRNCTIFDTVRQRAYTLIREPFLSEDMFRYELENHCRGVNNSFPAPLSANELNHIAKSISKWVWANMSPEGFINYQKAMNKRSQKGRQEKAKEKAYRVLDYAGGNPYATIREIATSLGYGRDFVHRVLTNKITLSDLPYQMIAPLGGGINK